MDNEPDSATQNTDNGDTNLTVNAQAENASRHSSRAGSARSGRSKAISLREATAIDGAQERKASGSSTKSTKPVEATNGEQQPSATVKSKPPTPVVPIIDTPSGEYDDDMMNGDAGHGKSEIDSVVSLLSIEV